MNAAWAVDLTVIVGYLALILGIGLYMGRREDTLSDFALGGRKIPWWAVLASIIAAETSAGTFLGTPGEGYDTRSYLYLQLALGTILARVIVSFIFLTPYYRYNVYSIYEYLTVRFGTGSKNAASAVFLLSRLLASGARIYVAAIALVLSYELFAGHTLDPALPADAHRMLLIYVLASAAVVILTAIYTTLGGIKAVIWTDFIQASIMMGSAVVALGILYFSIPGGWSEIRSGLPTQHLWNLFFSTGLNPARHGWQQYKGMFETEYTIYAGLIGSTFITMSTHGTDQDMVQRMLTAPDVRRSRRSLILSGLADLPIAFVFLSVGVLLFAYYHARPDPNLPKAPNEVFCYFILHRLPAGVRGLLLAGIFATSMGSLSTALNALATSFTRDWYLPYIRPAATEGESLRAVRWATVVFAVLMVGVSSAVSFLVIQRAGHPEQGNLRIIPIILGIFGYTYGSLLGIFFVGMLTKRRGRDGGNWLAMLAGFVVVAILSGLPNNVIRIFGGRPYAQPAWLPVVEFPWWIFFGTVTTFLVAVCFRSREEPVPAGKFTKISFEAGGGHGQSNGSPQP
jgi:SSS family solute:Na+ symporter